MLSVNGYTGAAWPHIWHGDYLGELTDSEVWGPVVRGPVFVRCSR
jgi:hypothetical protein